MELRYYANLLWRWLWLILLCAALAAISAYLVSRSMPRTYEASTTLLVNQAQTPGTVAYNDVLTSERLTKTYGELIRKRPVLDSAIASLNLPYDADQLGRMLSVQVVRDTMLLVLKAESTDPAQAADIANAISKAFIEENRKAQMGLAAQSRDALMEQIGDLERDIRTTSSQLDQLRSAQDGRTVETRQAEIARIQNALSQYQITYSQLLKSQQDMRLAESKAFSSVVVAEPAVVPTIPVSPRTAQNVILAALVGLMLAVGIALLVEYLDDTVKSSEDVGRVIGVPTLGHVMQCRKGESTELNLPVGGTAHSSMAEAFRVLRSNLQFSLLDRSGNALLISSAGPHEGKTTTAANLSRVMAQAGKKVIVVDADLRRPSLHHRFGLKNDVGLATALFDPSVLDTEALRSSGTDNLLVLTAGPLPPNPSELLGSPRMAALVEALKCRADLVLFDSPPALVVADPGVLAARMDGVVLVVDSSRTRAPALVGAKEALERAAGPGKLVGVVLNKLAAKSAGYHHYHYYRQAYGYTEERENGRGNRASVASNSGPEGLSG